MIQGSEVSDWEIAHRNRLVVFPNPQRLLDASHLKEAKETLVRTVGEEESFRLCYTFCHDVIVTHRRCFSPHVYGERSPEHKWYHSRLSGGLLGVPLGWG